MRIVMLGAPGSGKGTQGEKLALHHGIPKTSTGDALRAAVKAGTPLGLKAKVAMDAGQLVADELVIGIARERLAAPDAAKGFILDGFPRNAAQAKTLDALLAELGQPGLSKVIHLLVDDEEIVHRLVARGALEGRSDDNEATVRSRIAVYQSETRPLLDYYQARGLLVTIPGVGDIDAIFSVMLAATEPTVPEAAEA
ncbi:adenylate kinase [Nevskia ramosa]|uniref:adenylate kinase n=1 Tax=Nevskia ramosa TaxID=64002 RepID=UPI003D0CAC83